VSLSRFATHECPIAGCTRQVKNENLMCWPHWRRVPKILNRMIFDTCRARDWPNYQIARDEAVRIVTLKDKGWEYDL
jgi:hypothetical protein